MHWDAIQILGFLSMALWALAILQYRRYPHINNVISTPEHEHLEQKISKQSAKLIELEAKLNAGLRQHELEAKNRRLEKLLASSFQEVDALKSRMARDSVQKQSDNLINNKVRVHHSNEKRAESINDVARKANHSRGNKGKKERVINRSKQTVQVHVKQTQALVKSNLLQAKQAAMRGESAEKLVQKWQLPHAQASLLTRLYS